MRLRLGLLNEDLADRCGISPSTCSDIFKTWVRMISIQFGVLINWLPKESIMDHMPEMFLNNGYGKVRCILDCSEMTIERSKSLDAQAVSWSDYKHRNSIKFLIGISPCGYISFLSDCCGGRASDKFIVKDSGFYDLLDYGDQIKEELLLRYCNLTVPPGARMKAQMTSAEASKTKSVANLRIHVERAIRRIKTFRILSSTITITMLHHCDDIVRACAAFCNLKPMLIKPKKKR